MKLKPLGLMFHHFTDAERHPYIQGALTAERFDAILRKIGTRRFLKPRDWIERTVAGRLRPGDLCLTFDDTLASQNEIALPVMEAHDLEAFFFVYSSVLDGELELFELIRFFRNMCFPSPDSFYDAFFEEARASIYKVPIEHSLSNREWKKHLENYEFYTDADRRFRFVRDKILPQAEFYAICSRMMDRAGFSREEVGARIWLTTDNLVALAEAGHEIGLHSTTHPTNLGSCSIAEQRREYDYNFNQLSTLLGKRPDTAAYPSGSYDRNTIDIMRSLGIKIGFRSDLGGEDNPPLEQGRLDYTEYVQLM